MPTETELLQGIAEHPHELDRWLILSDWLEDQGVPRTELARLRYLLHVEPEHPERTERLARQQALLDTGLSPVVPERTNTLGQRFALILPGTFQMGSPDSEKDHLEDETLHVVELTEPYYLGVYPVTVGEFETFVEATGYKTEAEKDGGAWGFVNGNWKQDASITWRTPGFSQTGRHPVVCVSWNDAKAMVKWLNRRDRKSRMVYGLPTEAQWEYACRAGTRTAYFWGNDAGRLAEYAWFKDNSDNKTYPVETKKPSPWGLWHMTAHVWEWCQDWYGQYPFAAVKNPEGASSAGSSRVRRGGSWFSFASRCRSADRGHHDPSWCYTYDGFRLVASVRS